MKTIAIISVIIILIFAAGCKIDHGLEPKQESISGEITFLGTWPDSVEEVRAAAYAKIPVTEADFYLIAGFSEPLPLGVSSCGYTVLIGPGTYEWIIAVWRAKDSFWNLESLIGTYYAPGDTTQPGTVTVGCGQEVEGIDIVADFSSPGELP